MAKKAKKLEMPECIRALMVSEEALILFGDERTHKTDAAIEAFLMKAYRAGRDDLEEVYSYNHAADCACGCSG